MLDGGVDQAVLLPAASRVSLDREANPERVVDHHLARVVTMLDGTTSPVVLMLDGGADQAVLRQVASPERADQEANQERVVDHHLARVVTMLDGGVDQGTTVMVTDGAAARLLQVASLVNREAELSKIKKEDNALTCVGTINAPLLVSYKFVQEVSSYVTCNSLELLLSTSAPHPIHVPRKVGVHIV